MGRVTSYLYHLVWNNTIITFFQSVPENIGRGLSTDQVCEVGEMTEDSIPATGKKNSITIFIARICWKLTKEKLNCLNSYKIRILKG